MKQPPPPKFEMPPEPDWGNPIYRKWFMEEFLTDEDRTFFATLTPEQREAMFSEEPEARFSDEWCIESFERDRQRLRKAYILSGTELPAEAPEEWIGIRDLKSYFVKYEIWRRSIKETDRKSPGSNENRS